MEVVEIENGGKLSYDRVGMMKLVYPFVIDSDRLSTIFLYSLIEGQIVNASSVSHDLKEIVFEIQPDDHIIFQLNCNRNECSLDLYEIKVYTELMDYNGYEQYETVHVTVSKVYSAVFDRHRFRSFAVDNDAPDILRFVLMYLVPIELPYNNFHYSDIQEIVDKIKQFFWS
jgi:hypothetical protein